MEVLAFVLPFVGLLLVVGLLLAARRKIGQAKVTIRLKFYGAKLIIGLNYYSSHSDPRISWFYRPKQARDVLKEKLGQSFASYCKEAEASSGSAAKGGLLAEAKADGNDDVADYVEPYPAFASTTTTGDEPQKGPDQKGPADPDDVTLQVKGSSSDVTEGETSGTSGGPPATVKVSSSSSAELLAATSALPKRLVSPTESPTSQSLGQNSAEATALIGDSTEAVLEFSGITSQPPPPRPPQEPSPAQASTARKPGTAASHYRI